MGTSRNAGTADTGRRKLGETAGRAAIALGACAALVAGPGLASASALSPAALGGSTGGLAPGAFPQPVPVISPEIQLTAYNPAEWSGPLNGVWYNHVTGETSYLPPSFGQTSYLLSAIPAGCLAGDANACVVGPGALPLNPNPGLIGNIVGADGGALYLTAVAGFLTPQLQIVGAFAGIVGNLVGSVQTLLDQIDPSMTLSGMVIPTLESIALSPVNGMYYLILAQSQLLLSPFNIGLGAADATLVADFANAALDGHIDDTTIQLSDPEITALSADGSFVPDLFNDSLGDVPDGGIGDLVGALADIAPVL